MYRIEHKDQAGEWHNMKEFKAGADYSAHYEFIKWLNSRKIVKRLSDDFRLVSLKRDGISVGRILLLLTEPGIYKK